MIIIIISLTFIFYFINNNKNSNNDIVKKISEYNNPPVPDEFKKVETETASWNIENGIPKGWNKGLVIEDKLGNQFVWIPYIDELVKYNYKAENDMWEDTLPNSIKDEITQIKQYGGFYISRYEAGINSLNIENSTFSNITNNKDGIPISKQGAIPWNYISYKQAKENAEKMYEKENLQSGLMTISQYTNIIKWLNNSGFTDKWESEAPAYYGYYKYGNFLGQYQVLFNGKYSSNNGETYIESKGDIKSGTNIIITTGVCEKFNTNNIYDIFGNLSELTTLYGKGYCRVVGGDYSNMAYSNIKDYKEPSSRIGFRVVLYIK
jgi:hypothetical protein